MSEVNADGELLDVRTLVAVLWSRRAWIATTVVVVAAGFLAAALLLKPVYRASVVMISASSERGSLNGSLGSALGSLGGLASLAGLNLGSADGATEESLAVLKSRQFTEKFIADLGLMPKLFAKKWDAQAGKWLVAPDKQPTPAQACRYFDRKVRAVVQDKKTGLVTLQIDWRDRNEAAFWANELVRRLNAEMRARAIAKSDASVGYLEKELAATSELGTREAISRLMENQVKQRMLANVTADYAFRVVDMAMAPDKSDPVRPNRLALVLAGPLVGLALGIAGVLGVRSLRMLMQP